VAGGDGSFMGIADEAIKKGIDVTTVSFAMLPFGTGNDLA
jgi:diacylglycerol kinase family enzyme